MKRQLQKDRKFPNGKKKNADIFDYINIRTSIHKRYINKRKNKLKPGYKTDKGLIIKIYTESLETNKKKHKTYK